VEWKIQRADRTLGRKRETTESPEPPYAAGSFITMGRCPTLGARAAHSPSGRGNEENTDRGRRGCGKFVALLNIRKCSRR